MKSKKMTVKRVLAVLLALVMVFSTAPIVFAAPTGPVQETAGDHAGGKDAGHYVSFKVDKQNFTFIQTEDDQEFQFKFYLGAWKNAGVNYGWVYSQNDKPQTLTTPIGKSFTCVWGKTLGGLPGNLFGGNYEVGTDITVTFVADGGKVYNTALGVIYDAGSTADIERWDSQYNIPLTVTVLDKRALNSAIAAANAAAKDEALYTEATWGDVVTALSKANSVAGNVIDTQENIDRYASALQAAVEALEYKEADYGALGTAKADAEAILNDAKADDTYTIDSLENLRNKYAAAEEVAPDLDIRSQGTIDKAAADLAKAVADIEKFANYSVMQSAVAAFEKLNPAYFAPEDIAALKVKVDAAKEEMKRENKLPASEQADVNSRAMALLKEINSLEKLSADYKAFDKAVADARAKLESSDLQNYTSASVKALEDAYLAAADVEKGKDVTYQATVDEATKALTDALAGLTLRGADYTFLDNAIADAEAELLRSDIGDFTAESVDALRAALAAAKAVSRELNVNDQQIITDAASALRTAIRGLELKGADYSALDAAIAARKAEVINAKKEGVYTDASIARVEAAIELAESIDRTYSVKEQGLVDDMLATLNSVKLETKKADYTALLAAIDKAQNELNNADDTYTDESKAALREAIKAAREVVAADYDVTQQAKVDEAVKALESVTLVLKDADYSALDKAIQDAKDFLSDPETENLYTPEAIDKVKDALEKAESIDRDLDITEQDKIDSALDDLTAAMPGEGEYLPANTDGLANAVAEADKKLNAEDIADYTDESVAALKAARDEAQAMIDRGPDVTEQDKVNAKAEALANMTLTLKSADYGALELAAAEAEARYADALASGKYTAESLGKLAEAIAEANALLDSKTLTIKEQALVDEAVKALDVELTYKAADLSALLEAIANAEAKIAAPGYGDYTLASRQALETALAEAKAVYDADLDITRQAEVDAAADKLNNVKLSLSGANYTALDEIIAEANALLATNLSDKYTNASIADMKAALENAENVDRALDVNDQNLVDEAAAALRAAIDSLKTYNKVTDVEITDGNGGAVIDGDVIYVKANWYRPYRTEGKELGIKTNSGADIADVKWEYAGWSVENPEANIEDYGDVAVIRPNGKGFGARSCWVKVTVTDVNGNTAEDYVKVRFYKWSWQAK